jgi:hypothetical protein
MHGIPLRKTYEIVGWTYEADLHCNECAEERFGPPERVSGSGRELHGVDNEGNEIHPIFLDQLEEFETTPVCGDCFTPIK